MKSVCLANLILMAAWSAASPAQAAPPALPASVTACMSEQEDARRLSCYDREIARLSAQPRATQAPPPVAASPQAAPPQAPPAQVAAQAAAAQVAPKSAAPTDPEGGFGFRGEVAREAVDQRKAETSPLTQLDSTVAQIATHPHGELVVTLENAQVWVQKSPDTSFRLKTGDHVTIKKGSLGSFLMAGPTGRTTWVSRLR